METAKRAAKRVMETAVKNLKAMATETVMKAVTNRKSQPRSPMSRPWLPFTILWERNGS